MSFSKQTTCWVMKKYQGMDAVGKSQIGVAAGPAFFINPFIAIETIISWRSLKYKEAVSE